MLCAQDLPGWSGVGEVAEAEPWPSEPQAQQPLLCRPPYAMHRMSAGQECNVVHAWAPHSRGGGRAGGLSRGDERVHQA